MIHVRAAVDEDLEAAVAAGVSDAVERVTTKAGVPAVPYELHVAAGTTEDPTTALLDEVDAVKASILVIGARHRSPVGKAFLGSVSQRLILEADVPVLVVKPAR